MDTKLTHVDEMSRKRGLTPLYILFGVILLVGTTAVQAVPIKLDNTLSCNSGNAINGIDTTDVTGAAGGSNECWGTYDGNDPGPSGDGFQIGTTVYDFVAKQNTPGNIEGASIDLNVTPSDGATSGTWAFNSSLFDPSAFLIVLKAANSPGFAAWLFDGTAADSSAGTWRIAWTTGGGPSPSNPNLSHLGIYEAQVSIGPGPSVPEPAPLALIGLGGLLLGWMSRKSRA